MYLHFEVYNDVEFNDLDFGEFLGEKDVVDVEHLQHDEVLTIFQKGAFSCSSESTFMAPHRSRPNKKIILSEAPTGQGQDGFGTIISNINNHTPQLDHVLAHKLTELMCEFLEGKTSINNISNSEMTYVELSDSLVDCGPNADGLDSLFDILHLQTPAGFLEDLARQLKEIYEIEVSIVKGDKQGLLIKREQKPEW